MSRKRGKVELAEYASMAARVIRGYGHRFQEEGDEYELQMLADLHDVIDEEIMHAVGHIRLRSTVPVTYADLGRMFKITRQAARQRFDAGAIAKRRAYRKKVYAERKLSDGPSEGAAASSARRSETSAAAPASSGSSADSAAGF